MINDARQAGRDYSAQVSSGISPDPALSRASHDATAVPPKSAQLAQEPWTANAIATAVTSSARG
jgi:hypothetical protein